MTTHTPFQKLLLPTYQTIELVNIDEIIAVKADDNLSRLQLTRGRSLVSTQSFRKISEMLECHNFFKVHKSHLINLQYIIRFHKEGYVELSEGNKAPLARRRKEEFIETLRELTFQN